MILKNPPPPEEPRNQFCDDEINDLASVFKLLGDETRLRIVLYVCNQGTANVTELQKLVGLSQPLVSHHLGLLRGSGILESHREGKQRLYKLKAGRFETLMTMLSNRQQTFRACDRFLECVFG